MGASFGGDVNCCQRSQNRTPFNGLEIVVEDYKADGIRAKVAEHLSRGQPVLFPLPSPLPYIIVAADPVMVNLARGRPSDETVSRLISSLAEIEPMLALDMLGEARELARTHLKDERMTVLLPVEHNKKPMLASATMMMLHVIEEEDEDEGDFSRAASEMTAADVNSSVDGSESMVCTDSNQATFMSRSESLAVDLRTLNDNPFVPFGQFLQVDHLEELCSQQRPLYGSWGSAHQLTYAQSFPLILSQFRSVQQPYSLLALDAEDLREADIHHAQPSMSRIHPDGTWKYCCEGVNHGDLYGRKTRVWLTENERDAWLMH